MSFTFLEVPPRFELGNEGFAGLIHQTRNTLILLVFLPLICENVAYMLPIYVTHLFHSLRNLSAEPI